MKIGDSLPHFSLNDADGKLRSSDEFLNGKHLVLFFYPKNNTAGCTAEVCAFRDVYQDFLDADCAVVGVSGDTVASHALFADKHTLTLHHIVRRARHFEKSHAGSQKNVRINPRSGYIYL